MKQEVRNVIIVLAVVCVFYTAGVMEVVTLGKRTVETTRDEYSKVWCDEEKGIEYIKDYRAKGIALRMEQNGSISRCEKLDIDQGNKKE